MPYGLLQGHGNREREMAKRATDTNAKLGSLLNQTLTEQLPTLFWIRSPLEGVEVILIIICWCLTVTGVRFLVQAVHAISSALPWVVITTGAVVHWNDRETQVVAVMTMTMIIIILKMKILLIIIITTTTTTTIITTLNYNINIVKNSTWACADIEFSYLQVFKVIYALTCLKYRIWTHVRWIPYLQVTTYHINKYDTFYVKNNFITPCKKHQLQDKKNSSWLLSIKFNTAKSCWLILIAIFLSHS